MPLSSQLLSGTPSNLKSKLVHQKWNTEAYTMIKTMNIHDTEIEKLVDAAGEKIADIPLLTTLKIIEYNISVDQEV
jgi:hypothetical protein